MKGINKLTNNLIRKLSKIKFGVEHSAILSTKLKKNLVVFKEKQVWLNKKYLLENVDMRELLCIYAVNNINTNKEYCGWKELIQ